MLFYGFGFYRLRFEALLFEVIFLAFIVSGAGFKDLRFMVLYFEGK